MEKVRVDKWLWSVRIFKSRTLATDACKKRRIKIDDVPVKPSYLIKVGDKLDVHKNGFDLKFEVVKLIRKRVSAALAQPCYIDHTPEDELNKFKSWFIGKASAERREKGAGRPTKRERRELDDYKSSEYFDWDEFDE